MKKKSLIVFTLLACELAASPIVWKFPRLGGCHEGIAFADGITGVLVWGGKDTINLTVGRGDLWDHRGGYPWTHEQSYTNIVAAVASGDEKRLYGLFKKVTPKGEPRNPFLLSLGRVVIKIDGAELKTGSLDPKTGIGSLEFTLGAKTMKAELAMSKSPRAFAVKLPPGLNVSIDTMAAFDAPAVRKELEPIGYKNVQRLAPRKKIEGGFFWELPADPAVVLNWEMKGDAVLVGTARGDERRGFDDDCTFERVKSSSIEYWKKFWEEGAEVELPDERLQRIFDYGMYRFGAMTEPDGVAAGLQGAWLEDDKLVPWNGDYHFNINVQECYSPAYRGGHFKNLMPLFKMVLSWRDRLRDNARKFAGVDGYVLPHSVDDRGVCIGGFWTGTIDHASTAWIASMMYRYVRYSGDTAFLKNGAYDFMKGAMLVYREMMEEFEGRLSIPLGPSPEWGSMNVKKAVGRDPSFQLAAAHRLARDLIDAARLLGEKPDPMWLDVEKRLPEYTADNTGIMLFSGQRFVDSHRHHSHMAGLYPFDTIDFTGKEGRRVVENTYRTWIEKGPGLWSGWSVPWASILHTHIGHPDAAVFMLHAWETFFTNPGYGSRHDVYHPGFSLMRRGTNGQRMGVSGDAHGEEIMQMDGAMAAVTAIMELLVHDVNGKTEYFRGCPESWQKVSFRKIRLADGRSVSAERVNGKVSIKFSR